jgi:hypothetical protein
MKEEPGSEISDLLFVPLCLSVPEANIILQLSDQANFRVHKSLLASAIYFCTVCTGARPTGSIQAARIRLATE